MSGDEILLLDKIYRQRRYGRLEDLEALEELELISRRIIWPSTAMRKKDVMTLDRMSHRESRRNTGQSIQEYADSRWKQISQLALKFIQDL